MFVCSGTTEAQVVKRKKKVWEPAFLCGFGVFVVVWGLGGGVFVF